MPTPLGQHNLLYSRSCAQSVGTAATFISLALPAVWLGMLARCVPAPAGGGKSQAEDADR
jgi:hypothetical protein